MPDDEDDDESEERNEMCVPQCGSKTRKRRTLAGAKPLK